MFFSTILPSRATPALSEPAEQHNIAVDYATRQGELFAIARPRKVEDALVFELGQLFRRTAIERLRPNIRDAVRRADECNRTAIGRPLQVAKKVARNVKDLDGRAALNRKDRNLVLSARFIVETASALSPKNLC